MIKKYDLLLRLLKAMILFWNIMSFAYVWALYYNEKSTNGFYLERFLFAVFLFSIIYYAFGKLYNAFKVATYKISELVFSQLLAFGIADLCLYLESLVINRKYVNIVPGIITVGVQFVGTIILTSLSKRYYMKFIPSQRTLLIYGKDTYEDTSVFVKKVEKKLSHMFFVQEMICDAEGVSSINNKIEEYNTIILFHVRNKARAQILAQATSKGKNIYLTPRLEDILLSNFENRHMIDTPLLKSKDEIDEYFGKRCFDILVSGLMLIIFSPFMIITALGIKIEDHGPVFYKQKRVTKDGKVFEILKFRSMIVDAEAKGYKPCATGDSRITKVGRVIRATRLDELPQLLNIFKGDMSVVGPRPERVEHVEKYTRQLPEFAYRLRVRGGLTGYAQIYGKYNTSAEDKLKMDLMYIEKQSLIQDLRLIFLTVKIMFVPESTEGF